MSSTYIIEPHGDYGPTIRVRETGKYRNIKDGAQTVKVIQLEIIPRFEGDEVLEPETFWAVKDDRFLKEDYFTYEPPEL